MGYEFWPAHMMIEDVTTGRRPLRYEDIVQSVVMPSGLGDGVTDRTDVLQAAIDGLETRGGGELCLGPGTFVVSKLVLPTNVALVGAGCRATYLKAKQSAESAMIQIDAGPVQAGGLRRLRLDGGSPGAPTNAGQFAIKMESVADGTSTGGAWYGVTDEVYVRGFDSGLAIYGGSTGSALPMQFLRFKNLWLDLEVGGFGLDVLGHTGQLYFDHCLIQRRDASNRTGTLVRLGSSSQSNRPQDVTFMKCTLQNTDKGIETYQVIGLHLLYSWLENLYRAVNLTASTLASEMVGNHFANAGSDGASGGYLVQAGSSCRGRFDANVILGAYDTGVIATNSDGFDVGDDNEWATSPLVAYTSGVTKQLSITGTGTGAGGTGELVTKGHKTIGVNSSAVEIQKITSDLMPGNRLTVYALGGSIVFNTAAAATNLNLSGRSAPFTLASGYAATFVVTDLSARRFRLESVST